MSVKQENSDDCLGKASFEVNQVDSNPSVACIQLAVPVSVELMGERSETCTEPPVDLKAIIDHEITMERECLKDVCEPILHIDVKPEYSLHDVSWQEHYHLALQPKNDCFFELEETLSVETETVDYTVPQPQSESSGESATCQPTKDWVSQEPSLPKQSVLHGTTVECECNRVIGDTIMQCICSNMCKWNQTESKHYNVPSDSKCYNCNTYNKGFNNKASPLSQCRQPSMDHKPFQSEICSKHFSNKSQLKIQCRIHLDEKPYQCHICSKAFSRNYNLLTHCRMHTGEKPYQCHTCSKAFSRKNDLLNHCTIHTGEKPYQCHTCSMAFTQKSTLLKHCRIHTGEKPYQCHTCSIAFSRKSTLLKHCRIHTGEKPYQCHTCNKPFSQKSSLLEHCKIHTGVKPYHCHTCSKAFIQKGDLLKHCTIHTGEKPYQCHTCSKAFTLKSALLRHCRIHTGGKPYPFVPCHT